MKSPISLLLLLLLLLMAMLPIATGASAQTVKTEPVTRSFTTGRSGTLGVFSSFDDACNVRAIPQVTVQRQPSHGTLRLTQEKVPVHQTLLGKVDCSGHQMEGMRARFMPAAGYAGPDHAILVVQFASGVIEYDYDITITPPH